MSLLNHFLLSTTALTRGDLISEAPVTFGNKKYSNVGELIMSAKLTASYKAPASGEEEPDDDEDIHALMDSFSGDDMDEGEKSLSCIMHERFAGVLAHLFHKHYKLDHIALGVSQHPLSDHTSAISVLFSDDVALTGKDRLDILNKLSRFLGDLQNVTAAMDGMEIDAKEADSIFSLIYEPATMGAALALLVEQFAPADQEMGEGLFDASILLERVKNFTPAFGLN